MPVTVYGSSDNLIEIEGDVSKELMASSPRLLRFNDGTGMVVFDRMRKRAEFRRGEG